MKKTKNLIIFVLFALVLKSYSQTNITATIPYSGSYASGEYQIFRFDKITNTILDNITLNNLRKPLVFVEPYDANNERKQIIVQ